LSEGLTDRPHKGKAAFFQTAVEPRDTPSPPDALARAEPLSRRRWTAQMVLADAMHTVMLYPIADNEALGSTC